MANSIGLSDKLKNFKNSYDSTGGLQSLSSNMADFSTSLLTIFNSLNETVAKFKESGNDSVINSIVANTTLAKDGIERVKIHVDSDLKDVISKTKEVNDTIINKINDLVTERDGYATKINAEYNKEADKRSKDLPYWQSRVKDLEASIDDQNKKGEAQIDAIKAAIDGINFGVAGNMHPGGVLGLSLTFSDNYAFEWDDYVVGSGELQAPNEEQPKATGNLGIGQELGCAVVGAVESVVKVGEGIIDAVLTPFAGLWSLITGDDNNVLRKAIDFDVAGETVGALGGFVAGSKEAYENSTGKKVGGLAGSVVAHGALWVSGLGILSATSVGGNRAEEIIQDGKTIGEALWRGTVAGGLSYTAAKILPKVASGISNKLSTYAATHTNALAKGITSLANFTSRVVKAGSTGFKDWGTLGTKGKVVSLVATPARLAVGAVNKSINTGAKLLTNSVGQTGLGKGLIKADTKVDELLTTARVRITKTGRQQIEDYETAREAWENAGRQVNSAEYDQLVKAQEKIPEGLRPNIGDKAFTAREIDSLRTNYNKAKITWENAGGNTSGPEYDALNKAYQKIPQYARPTNVGDLAYSTSTTNYYANKYNDATDAWIRNGMPNSGAEYDAMQLAHNKLPPQLRSSTTLGNFAAGSGYSDYSIDFYNSKLTDWKIAGSPASGAEYDAMKQAFDNIPNGLLKPTTMGEIGMNSHTLSELQRKYNNELVNWTLGGSQQYGTDYQSMVNAWNALPNSVRPVNAGDLFGTGIAPATAGEKLGGGIISGIIGNS